MVGNKVEYLVSLQRKKHNLRLTISATILYLAHTPANMGFWGPDPPRRKGSGGELCWSNITFYNLKLILYTLERADDGHVPGRPSPKQSILQRFQRQRRSRFLILLFSFTLFFRKCNGPRKHAHFEHWSGHAAFSTASLPLRFYSPPALYNSTHSATAANQFPQQSSAWIGGVRFGESHRWVSSDSVGIKVTFSFGLLNISYLSGLSNKYLREIRNLVNNATS